MSIEEGRAEDGMQMVSYVSSSQRVVLLLFVVHFLLSMHLKSLLRCIEDSWGVFLPPSLQLKEERRFPGNNTLNDLREALY